MFFQSYGILFAGIQENTGKKEIPFEGRTEKISTCKTGKVDHAYQHVIKTEDVLLLLLEHCIIECTRILRNNYSVCFCVFNKKNKTPKQKQQPHTRTNKPITNVSTSMPICYNGYIQYVKRYVSQSNDILMYSDEAKTIFFYLT